MVTEDNTYIHSYTKQKEYNLNDISCVFHQNISFEFLIHFKKHRRIFGAIGCLFIALFIPLGTKLSKIDASNIYFYYVLPVNCTRKLLSTYFWLYVIFYWCNGINYILKRAIKEPWFNSSLFHSLVVPANQSYPCPLNPAWSIFHTYSNQFQSIPPRSNQFQSDQSR